MYHLLGYTHPSHRRPTDLQQLIDIPVPTNATFKNFLAKKVWHAQCPGLTWPVFNKEGFDTLSLSQIAGRVQASSHGSNSSFSRNWEIVWRCLSYFLHRGRKLSVSFGFSIFPSKWNSTLSSSVLLMFPGATLDAPLSLYLSICIYVCVFMYRNAYTLHIYIIYHILGKRVRSLNGTTWKPRTVDVALEKLGLSDSFPQVKLQNTSLPHALPIWISWPKRVRPAVHGMAAVWILHLKFEFKGITSHHTFELHQWSPWIWTEILKICHLS